jgi:hypothetical protein
MHPDDFSPDQPQPDPTPDFQAEEPIGMQEASVQGLLEQEQAAIAEPEESVSEPPPARAVEAGESIEPQVSELQQRLQALKQDVQELEETRDRLQSQVAESQMILGRLVQEGLSELEQRKQALKVSVEQLERRQERVKNEMRTSFAGVSQDVSIRVQSFKDYLVGSLQDLALTAEQLDLQPKGREVERVSDRSERSERPSPDDRGKSAPAPRFAEQSFQEQTKKIRGLIDQYRNRPDYYGSAWQLRRTFEPVHAERVANWFFTQGGRGATRTLGSRLQNILVASATISILRSIYGDRLRTLLVAESPERLGEWRRGLQDCLGITRSDFGPDRGVGLFEDPVTVSQRAERLLKDGLMPLIVIDETEDQISLAMLQFPLWLAFAPNPQAQTYPY